MKYQDLGIIRIMPDGFVWEIIEYGCAEGYIGGIYELFEDGTESLIEDGKELNKDSTYGIELGFIGVDIAKSMLKTKGYFVDNLWSVNDVIEHYKVTKEEAQYILDKSLTNDATMEQIWFSIHEFAQLEGHEPQSNKE